ncbi:MAG: GNAT family N-acetyltransferase [Clostridiales bacterium]|nr:GNAT family N-acetyltransferase [Clostridiales bacterium]
MCKLRWYFEEEILDLYDDKRFTQALEYGENKLLKDMIAVAAINDDHIVGMAGASSDSDTIWQIGIDVIPEFRQQNIAATLVSTITDKIIEMGKVPFYGTWWGNIASRKVAFNSGYQPVWVELGAYPSKKDE